MRQLLLPPTIETEAGRDPSRWTILPHLCCQAAGGDPLWADGLAAAWLLLYTAAHLMDKIEDQEEPDSSWAPHGPGAALNAATGLFFTASLALNDLYQHDETRLTAGAVLSDFYSNFLRMSSGQHSDLTISEPTLEQYWEIARDKSGAFFEVACRCGARLASASPDRLEGFSQYGLHLGILKQILDDLEDIQPPDNSHSLRPWPDIARSLPVVYAMSVFPEDQSASLRQCLQNAAHRPEAGVEAFRLLEQSGAALYLNIEIEHQRELALQAVEQAEAQPPARQVLISIVQNL